MLSTPSPTDWLRDAVVYEIYPQSFADSDGDGIGDLPGVLAHLDHLSWLGVDAVWFNPCFASPFRDAGYDVSDYLQVAPRYGSNDDMVAVVWACQERGIRVLLDLVAGHTSDEHEWFRAELEAGAGAATDPSQDRYVWADRAGGGLVASPGPRPGWYLKNFYDSQPALNFGYARTHPDEPWRQPADAPGPRANRDALREVMAFWLERGVSGFRVDMAFSLVKDDPGHAETVRLWRELREWLDVEHPGAVIVPEGEEPTVPGVQPAFHADFALVIHALHSSLLNNGGAGRLPWWDSTGCYFDADGSGSTETFLRGWTEHQQLHDGGRPMLLASSDHDYSRLVCGTRTAQELGAVFTFLLTWGTVPSIFAGDEIGMRYVPGLPDVEGSICHPTYNRAGARTPVQWEPGPGAGFSTAAEASFYLPLDQDPARPDVATQRADPGSLLHLVRRLLRLRRETPALRVGPTTQVLHTGHPLVYLRGGTHLVALNPTRAPVEVDLAQVVGATLLLGHGVSTDGTRVQVQGFGHGVWQVG